MLSVIRGKAKDARGTARSRSSVRDTWPLALRAIDRRRIEAALARRAAHERLMLALLLYERMRPMEVAGALGVSARQVGRTYQAMIDELRRSVGRRTRRTLASRGRASVTGTRLRKAA